MAMAIGAIENAVLDAKAKELGIPCVDLLGGSVREEIPVYWSHCGSYRITQPEYYEPVRTLEDVRALGEEVRESQFTALKTNIFDFSGDEPTGWAPGFGRPFHPSLTIERAQIEELRRYLETLREGTGHEVEILLDLNYNAKPEGYIRIVEELADFDLFWVEIDSPDATALADVRAHSPHPISNVEAEPPASRSEGFRLIGSTTRVGRGRQRGSKLPRAVRTGLRPVSRSRHSTRQPTRQ